MKPCTFVFILVSLSASFLSFHCFAAGIRHDAHRKENELNAQQENTKESRIVGGRDVNVGDHQYFVQTDMSCGGSLIYEDIVLTAAHCVWESWSPWRDFRPEVWVGSRGSRDGFQNSVVLASPHPNYDNFTYEYDYMIMKLRNAVPASIARPIPFNSDASNPSTGDILTALGFGSVYEGGYRPDTLLEVDIPFVPHDRCSSLYNFDLWVRNDTMFCAGERGADSCFGDSGGPIVDSNGVQVGIISWGFGCAETHPGVNSRVSFVHDWIEEQICIHSANPPLSCGNRIRAGLSLMLDGSPDETGLVLQDTQSNEVILFQESILNQGSSSIEVNLRPGTYMFEVRQDNGLCSSSVFGGDGSYSIFAGGTSIDRDAVFTNRDHVYFRVEESGQIIESSGVPLPQVDATVQQPIQQNPTPSLTMTDFEITTPEEPNDLGNLVEVRIDIIEDSNPHETAWMLINQDTGEQVHLSQYKTVDVVGRVTTYLSVPTGRYWFLLLDSGGDGLCCANGSGGARIYQYIGTTIIPKVYDTGEFQRQVEYFFDLE